MPHDVGLIAMLATGFGLALIFGFIATRLRMPPLVGYLFAGILIGPATPGFVADANLARQLAEIGVMLLMFGVGLRFSLQDLMAVKHIAVPGAIIQIIVAVLLGMGAASLWGWNISGALVFGLCLSVASTVVLLRALEAKELLNSVNGQIAVGWLVVEDLVMVLVLVLLPVLAHVLSVTTAAHYTVTASLSELWKEVAMTLAKVAAFIILMLLIGRRVLPKILWYVARTGSRELFTLSVVVVAVGVAFGAAKLFDISFALGAFFSGMMMRGSEFSHRAADESLPLRDAFAVLFFVSVGMLFDPHIIWAEPMKLLIVVAIIMVGKTIAAVALVLLFRYPLNTALIVGASLAQIGEFSFILAGLGVALNLMPIEGQSLVLAAALISIAANSVVFSFVDFFESWFLKRTVFSKQLQQLEDPLAHLPNSVDETALMNHIILVGYGRVGRRISEVIQANQLPFVVVEQNRQTIHDLRKAGTLAIVGDAATLEVQLRAHITTAAMLVIAIQDTVNLRKMIEIARQQNPTVFVILRTHNEEEAELFSQEGLSTVFLGEKELAQNMSARILEEFNRHRA